MNLRVVILLALVAAAGVARWQAQPVEVADAVPLANLPLALESWTGRAATEYSPRVLAALGVDDHINRSYVSATGRRANVYIGYYRAQQQGTSVHSPLNCLPGAGWEPEAVERIPFAGGAARLVRIRKADKRLMVLYWYQTATRIEGNEYLGRLYTVIDTLRYGRNDAALVRVTVSIGSSRDAEARAIRTATEFATVVQPHVGRLLFAGRPPQTLAEVR